MNVFKPFLDAMADPAQRERTAQVLDWVAATFPQLEGKIAWNQPMFTDHGTFIIGFSTAKQHLAVAPELAGITRFSDEIVAAGYQHSQQIVRMPWNKPIDYALLERMIAFNIADKADYAPFWRKAAK